MLRVFKYGANRAPIKTFKQWKILSEDKVIVLAGKEKGKAGRVSKVIRKKNQVVIEGLNLVKKHVRGNEKAPGTIITKEMPIHVSNVALIDPTDGKPTRVKWHLHENERVRVSKRTGAIIEKPAILKTLRRAKRGEPGSKDTLAEIVTMKTFDENSLLPKEVRERLLVETPETIQPL